MASTVWAPRGVNTKELREEKRELEQRLHIVNTLLGAIEGIDAVPRRRRRRRANTRLNQMVAVLKDANRPLHVKAIYAAMKEKDPDLRWRQPGASIRSYIRTQEPGPDEVVGDGAGVYRLKAWDERADASEPAEERTVTPTTTKDLVRKLTGE